jgi:hypothetical protein
MSIGCWARAVGVAGLTVVVACDDPESPSDSGIVEVFDDGGSGPDGAIGDGGSGVGHGSEGGPGVQDGGTGINNPFAIYGRLASAPGDKQLKAGGDAAVEHSITHVMAVNSATANPVRYVAEIAADGSFAIGIDLNAPWVIVLVDSHQVGADMTAGVFRAQDFDLDSLSPTAAGRLELGDVTVDDSGAASASITTTALLSSLGLTAEAAVLIGAVDDISLRYVNPDIDGNGKIDALEGVSYPLDFHLRYTMQTGPTPIPFTALLNQYADANSTMATYGLGSAIAYWEPTRFGTTSAADYRIRFPHSFGTYSAPPTIGAFTANTWIEQDSAFYSSAGTNSLGISFNQSQPFPIGTYEFGVKDTVLTFTNVHTHSLAELNQNAHLIVPFIKLNAPNATCEGWTCKVSGFDYKWMKRTPTSWVAATEEEVALIVPLRGGFLGFRPGGVSGKVLEYRIPGAPVTGTINFAATSNIQGGVSAGEIADLTVDDLCHVGLSYDDTLGMRIFVGYQQGPGCP